MSRSMQIYNKSPIFVQNIFTTIQGYVLKRERFSKAYFKEMEEISRLEKLDYNLKVDIQLKKFKELLHYAKLNSPFYKQLYENVNINEISTLDDIKKLPIVSKEMVRANLANIYTIKENEAIVSNTSGTTGTSMKFLYTKNDLQKRLAYLDYFKMTHGYEAMIMRRASFSSPKIIPLKQKSKIYWRYNLAIKQKIYSSYHIRGENIKFVVKDLNKFKPKAIDGYPSAIYEVANFIKKNNVKLDFTPIAIFPTAETLFPKYKKVIEEVFQCPVRDQYASSEGAPFITECVFGKLHYNILTGIIETNENNEMLVTCFNTHGTPLIRYEIGDRCIFEENKIKCKCGSKDPIVKSIQGRTLDYISTPSKGDFPAIYFSLVSEDFENSIKKMQFVQDEVSQLVVLLEVGMNYHKSMNEIIINKLKFSLGEDMKIFIKIVDEIPREPSGKFKLIKNNLKKTRCE